MKYFLSQTSSPPLSIYRILILLILLPALLGCEEKDRDHKKYGGTLVVGTHYPFKPITPLLTETTLSASISKNLVFNGLVKSTFSESYRLDLAKSITPAQKGNQLEVLLKEGVTFHDGVELTAKDVKFTYEMAMAQKEPLPGKRKSHFIEKIVLTGKYRLTLHLKEDHRWVEGLLDLGILPSHILEGEEMGISRFNQNPIGTGPYGVARWSEEETLLKSYRGHFAGEPYIEQIVFRDMKNSSNLLGQLVKGNVDVAYLISPDRVPSLEKEAPIKTHSFLSPYYYIVGFNGEKPLLRNPRLRKALNYAVNKKRILDEVLLGRGEIMRSIIFMQDSWNRKYLEDPFPYDPKKAGKLLKEMGAENLNLKVCTTDSEVLLKKTLRYIKEDLAQVGVNLQIRLFDLKTTMEKVRKKDFDLVLIYIHAGKGPDTAYHFWHSSMMNKGSNYFSYKNKDADEILDLARKERNSHKKKKLYNRLYEAMRKDPPGIYLFWSQRVVAINKRVETPTVKLTYIEDFPQWYILPEKRQKQR